MKIILIENIEKIGKKHDVKDVSNGYAVNFLFPKNLAIVYTDKNFEIIKQKNEKEVNINQTSEIDKIKNVIDLNLKFKEKTAPTGKLFAQVNKDKIVEKIFKEYKIKLKSEDLIIKKPLKELGSYSLGLKPNLNNIIKVIIEKDE